MTLYDVGVGVDMNVNVVEDDLICDMMDLDRVTLMLTWIRKSMAGWLDGDC
jgi:hypothetical protein